MKYFSLSNKLIPILCGFLLTFMAITIQLQKLPILSVVIQRLDNVVYDIRQNAFLRKASLKDVPIVIVDIDEKSLKAEGHWPWPRNKLALLVQQLRKQGAVVIAFDFLFPEPEPNVAAEMLKKLQDSNQADAPLTAAVTKYLPTFDNDRQFADALKQGDNILGIFFNNNLASSTGVLPPPLLRLTSADDRQLSITTMNKYVANIPLLEQAAQHAASVAIVPDGDGIMRRYSLLIRYGDYVYPSLALEAIRQYLLINKIKLNTAKIGDINTVDSVQLGDVSIPTDQRGSALVNFQGPAFTFPYVSASDVLRNSLPPHKLENMIVFIGTSAVGLGDLQATPVQSVYPGVEIHATMAASILQNKFLYKPAWAAGAELATLIFCGIVLSILFPFLGPLWTTIVSVFSISVLIYSTNWLWKMDGLVLPVVLTFILIGGLTLFNIAYGFFSEQRRRSELKQAFSEYVPAAHIEQLISSGGLAAFEGEKRDMTVLFMDIRNFTTISEKLSIVDLKRLLNFFFTEMTGIIFKHGGTIDKYVGDMVMAFWGAPLNDPQNAQHAVSAALEMLSTTLALKSTFLDMELPTVNVGIGLNSGPMNVGDMGSKFRRSYTVIGDTVNLASRLEGLTKYYKVSIVIGEQTYQQLNGIICRQLDKVTVKGKEIPLDIYEPLCRAEDASPDLMNDLAQHQQALNYYFVKQWSLAQTIFLQLRERYPNYYLYSIFLSRIEHFIQEPPPEDWDGTWKHVAK